MCDFDPPAFYNEQERRSRKARTCRDCGDIIPAGTAHRVATGKWDLAVSSIRFCARCVRVRDYLGKLNVDGEGGNCIPFGELFDTLDYNRADLPREPADVDEAVVLGEAWGMLVGLEIDRYDRRETRLRELLAARAERQRAAEAG